MPVRVLLAAGVTAALALAAIVVAGLTRGGGGGGGVDAQRVRATGWAGAVRPPAVPPAAFALRDERGRAVRIDAYRGQVVALMFVYSTCQDTCPLTAAQVRGALDEVDRDDVQAIAVSVDPARDTQRTVRTFLAEQRIAGRVPYLMGTRAQLSPVWRAFGVQAQEQEQEHSVSVVLLDRSGRQRVGFGPDDLTADGLAHDLRELAS